ncbi:MAG: hypothetical protein GY778_16385 [bacterium]|nr:hypothetical protein [bacterium]
MKTKHKAIATVGLMGVGCLVVAAGPESAAIDQAPAWGEVTYTLLPESISASGCKPSGSLWPPCPACPTHMATEFTGTLTLTPRIRVPQGHRIYDVTIEDWLVTFYHHDEPTEITGGGTYDRWTWTDGSSWQIMTLDLCIDDEEFHFFSGVVEDPNLPGGPYPDIQISLESDTECWGYWFFLEAEHVRAAVPAEAPVPPEKVVLVAS